MVPPCIPFLPHNNGHPTANQRAELCNRDIMGTQGIHDNMGAMVTPQEAKWKPLEQYANNSLAQLQDHKQIGRQLADKPDKLRPTHANGWDQMDVDCWETGKDRIRYITQKHLKLGITVQMYKCTNKYQFCSLITLIQSKNVNRTKVRKVIAEYYKTCL